MTVGRTQVCLRSGLALPQKIKTEPDQDLDLTTDFRKYREQKGQKAMLNTTIGLKLAKARMQEALQNK